MAFTWDGRYVLRRIDEDDPAYHRVYKHSDRPDDITDADNYFSTAPALAAKSRYDAERVAPPPAWQVSLANNPTVPMGIFVLRGKP
ncbi:hypothetical protein NX786_02135 [Telluria mixta]|uniref:Uncharacterized protein n=1 Tax=Telluria mixta TaxID=34071 RepID=A0ABT2BT41_9BURK|nr:hypothetical protein [Telluria mixta]MCS0628142.1 hypothetical protein [Telluria mixta]WEM93742.1 hypothetical protein P0M04_19855 [Telluria mixta]